MKILISGFLISGLYCKPFVFVAGILRDIYNSYIPGLLLMAALITVGAVLLWTLPLGDRLEKRRKQTEVNDVTVYC